MQVKKRFLARLPWVYAITTLELEGRTWCLAASELEGEGGDCLLIDPDTGAVHTVWNRAGRGHVSGAHSGGGGGVPVH